MDWKWSIIRLIVGFSGGWFLAELTKCSVLRIGCP